VGELRDLEQREAVADAELRGGGDDGLESPTG
jgi:hypothetical protein